MFLRSSYLFLLALLAGCAAPHTLSPVVSPSASRTPLILVSIDGFRADYLDRGVSPTLSALAKEGVRAAGMQPSFPSLTFPNHYTLVTGDYPDHHGIVDNAMFDPVLGSFTLGNEEAVGDGRWWEQAEPIWVTADRQGVKTATMYWPGSEASIHGYRPDYWNRYDGDTTYEWRVDQVLRWLDLPPSQRPGFITLYFEAVDTAGHYDGPDSPKTNAAIAQVDTALSRLVQGLRQRGRLDQVNLIVLADHGMAATPPAQRIFLDDLIDPAHARAVSTGAISGIIPAAGHEREVSSALLQPHPHMTCWNKAQIPERLHYGHNPRVPPLFCLAQTGWLITHNATTALHHGQALYGEHGFDNADPPMRALFVAHGPAFRKNLAVPMFPNVNVYPLLAHLLRITPQANDGEFDAMQKMFVPGEL